MDDFKRLLQLAYPHRFRLITATSILLLGTLLNLAIPTQIRELLDSVFSESDGVVLDRVTFVVALLLVFRMFTGVVSGYLLEWTGERIVADLRQRLFDHLLRLDLNFFTHTRLGEITSRMTNDVTMIQSVVTSTLSNVIERILLTLGSLTIMLWFNWRLTIAVFTTMPLVVLITRIFGKKVRAFTREAQDRLAAANAVMEETLGAIRVVKIFVREPHEQERFGHEIESIFAMVRARARIQAFYVPTVSMLFMGALVLVVWLGAQEVLAGRLTVGEMFAFLMYAGLISSSASMFASAYGMLKKGVGASERIFELLATPPQIQSPPNAVDLRPLRGAIRFENVSFSYQEGFPILRDLSFTIERGEVVALVGVSGVGKSTLMDLIARYYDVTEGRILVDGVDLRQADLASLRTGIGSVPQDTVLFGDTVRTNLRYGRLDATEEEIMAAARAANAHDFIMALPNAYDTLVGERGVRLSGGQRQRIAIGRALLKDPAILLLDEATSSLDSESERAVQAALDELLASRGRTTLVIAHRLSTIRNADRILVLAPKDGIGHLVEQGTHEELLAQRGVYYHLYTLQFHDETENFLVL
ncbi:MAG: ABC transporter ATP-binding protein [Ardenticatenaceae bacterium]